MMGKNVRYLTKSKFNTCKKKCHSVMYGKHIVGMWIDVEMKNSSLR